MDLLDRYVQAVKFWLPKMLRNDIAVELSEDIRSQIDEQEAAFGRKLHEAEIAAILKERGRPLLVANFYLPQESLIGPVLFPVYRFVLKIVILCYLAPSLLVWIGLMSFDPAYRSSHSVAEVVISAAGRLWVTALLAVGVVTVIFAILERLQSRSGFLENWDPRRLRPVRDPRRIPRYASVLELAVLAVFVLWWVKIAWVQPVFSLASIAIMLGPAWRIFFWAYLLLALASIGLSATNLSRPYWTGYRGSIRLLINCAGAVVFCWLLKSHLLAGISAPHVSPARAADLVSAINMNMAKSFPFAAAILGTIVGLSDVGRLIRIRSRSREGTVACAPG